MTQNQALNFFAVQKIPKPKIKFFIIFSFSVQAHENQPNRYFPADIFAYSATLLAAKPFISEEL